jgi:hypothetical protein
MDAGAGQPLAQARKLTVFGPEIVPPLADAVRFVYGDEADAAGGEEREKAVAAVSDQPLGRHIQEAVPSFPQSRRHGALFRRGQ